MSLATRNPAPALSFNRRAAQLAQRGHLCVGLDPMPDALPEGIRADREGIGRFLGALIEATSPYAVAYKPNSAFYEALGPWGWEILESLREVIPSDKLFILDAKRGDVGHTARRYAHAAFGRIGADAVTLSPYLGEDGVEPFLGDPERGVFLLCLTSNASAGRWQTRELEGEPFYLRVAEWARELSVADNVGLVVGATHPDQIGALRRAAPGLPLLIPGVGVQGGQLEAVVRKVHGTAYLVNASRSIACASAGRDFADAAADAAARLHDQIEKIEGALVGT